MQLSIFIPSYNYGRYLKQAIESVINQSFTDYELIIIDDGSTDDSPKIIEEFASKYPQIKYIRHENNRGFFERENEAIHIASGKYFHSFSADDIYLEGFLSKSMQLLIDNPHLGLVCSDIGYFQDGTEEIESKKFLPLTKPQIYSPDELAHTLKTTPFWVPGTCCIVKRNLFIQYGGLDQKLENISDWFLFHHIALFEGVGYIPETLIAMRVHNNSYTSTVKRNKKRRRATYKHLLNVLSQKSHSAVKKRFLQAGALDFVRREFSWKLLLNPRYWSFY